MPPTAQAGYKRPIFLKSLLRGDRSGHLCGRIKTQLPCQDMSLPWH